MAEFLLAQVAEELVSLLISCHSPNLHKTLMFVRSDIYIQVNTELLCAKSSQVVEKSCQAHWASSDHMALCHSA